MLYQFLRDHMLNYPEQILSDGRQTITYRELLAYAEEFGKTLEMDKYGLLFESDLDTAKALLACFYANRTAVLLSKKYGDLHTRRIVEAMKLSHIISDDGIKQISQLQDEEENLEDVSLIMCTSGTTGMPKGAMITADNLIANLNDIAAYFEIGAEDHILIARPLYHCAVLTGEFLISLLKGLKITFVSDGFVPVKILRAARKIKATVLCGTPTLLYHLSVLNLKAEIPLVLSSIAVSGECMTEMVAKTMRRAFVHTEIYNVYGLTEASPRVCYLPPNEFDVHPLSVGWPLASLQAKIDDNELLVSGKSIMKGYYDNEPATNRVVRDGWLHTGDVAEEDAEGRIYIKCRKDNMIIRAGMNIYPQEIESLLKEDSRIEDVLAYGKKNSSVSEKICIDVVTKLEKNEVYEICKKRLMSYELPDYIEIVEEIPKNASGKVIRRIV